MEYAVIGLGRFGVAVATQLQKNGHDVIAVDVDPIKCRSIAPDVAYTVILDATDERALIEANLHHIDVIIVGMGESSMTNSVLTCLNLLNMNVKNIYAKATSSQHKEILSKIGITNIIRPESDMGRRLAMKLRNNSLLDYIELSDDVRIEGYKVEKTLLKYAGNTIYGINLRKSYGINIVCIKRQKELIVPDSETLIMENDVLIIVGETEKVEKFEKKICKKD